MLGSFRPPSLCISFLFVCIVSCSPLPCQWGLQNLDGDPTKRLFSLTYPLQVVRLFAGVGDRAEAQTAQGVVWAANDFKPGRVAAVRLDSKRAYGAGEIKVEFPIFQNPYPPEQAPSQTKWRLPLLWKQDQPSAAVKHDLCSQPPSTAAPQVE